MSTTDTVPGRPHALGATSHPVRSAWLLTGGIVVLCAAVAKLAVHLYAGGSYGYFIDELYYLACARHLAWGYVDQPPLIALVTWLGVHLFGESLRAIHIFPALAGAAIIILTGLIARNWAAAVSRRAWRPWPCCSLPAFWAWTTCSP